MAICLLEELLTRANRAQLLKSYKKVGKRNGANYVEPPDELEKKLRSETIERFGGTTVDLSKAAKNPYQNGLPKTRNTQTSHELRLAFQHKLHARIYLHPPPTHNFLRIWTVSAKDSLARTWRAVVLETDEIDFL
jgi:hypothetical protein